MGSRRYELTLSALLQRINRKLAKEGSRLKKIGDEWYIIDRATGDIEAHTSEPVRLGRAMGVLARHEVVVEKALKTAKTRG
jgi:hypothetical protein